MPEKLPRHVAIVMDGNGRWAEQRGLARIEGHKAGADSVRAMVRCCLEKQISCLSLFAFSSENWSRPVDEVNFIMRLFLESLNKECNELHQNGVRIRFTGHRQQLSPVLQQEMHEAEKLTLANQNLLLNIVVNYGGKWDIVNATKKIVAAVQQGELDLKALDEHRFSHYLDTGDLPEPDLLIRTSGELRISNFFLWQLAYTELYFSETHWPDFTASEFEQALCSFSQRVRRYGQLTDRQAQSQEENAYV